MKKRILEVLLILTLMISIFSAVATPASADAADYDVEAALTYARQHWNDGVGLCAEFVWNCVKAGGLELSTNGLWESYMVTTGCAQGICNALGVPYKGVKAFDPIVLGSNGYAYASNNPNLNAGDIVFQYCTTCGLTPHVVICSGFNSQGVAKFYAHNVAKNDSPIYLNSSGLHGKSSCNVVAKFIDMPNTNPVQPAPSLPEKDRGCACKQFLDVDHSAWYHNDVDYMVAHGYMNGMSTTQFAPEEITTRAMLVTVLYRIAGKPSVAGLSHDFSDIDRKSWYGDAVVWASNNDIMIGMGNGKFCPENNLTREQLMVTLYRYSKYCGITADLSVGANRWEQLVDRDRISSWASDGVTWGVYCGIMQGDTDLRLRPQDAATRAEFCAVIHRYLEKVC